MAAFGIWLWLNPGSFGERDYSCALDASFSIIGKSVQVPLGSKPLRLISLVIYFILVVPGLNLIPPMLLFLGLFIVLHKVTRNSLLTRIPHTDILPASIGINLVLIVDLESTLQQNQHLQQDTEESDWGFGQILALLLLILPLRDVLGRSYIYNLTGSLLNAIKEGSGKKVMDLIRKGADINLMVKGMYIIAGQICPSLLIVVCR
jgi:hypothetical protein